jgi:putative sterol carrier protein
MVTMKEVFEERIPQRLKERAEKVASVNAIYEFNITGDGGGIWSIDLTGGNRSVTTGSTGKANCTVTVSASDFSDIIQGKLNPQMAFMTGKLKVSGDMGLALKLGSIL